MTPLRLISFGIQAVSVAFLVKSTGSLSCSRSLSRRQNGGLLVSSSVAQHSVDLWADRQDVDRNGRMQHYTWRSNRKIQIEILSVGTLHSEGHQSRSVAIPQHKGRGREQRIRWSG